MADPPPPYSARLVTGAQSSQPATQHPSGPATYSVLSSAPLVASAGGGGSLQPASRVASGSFMRFTPATAAPLPGSGSGRGADTYAASQAAHAAHVAASERAEREAARAAKEARSRAARARHAARLEAQAHSSGSGDELQGENTLRARKHSFSVSSRSHKTDMFGQSYGGHFGAGSGGSTGTGSDDPAPVAPPMSALHRSPSFEKRLVESARFAGAEIEDEDEINQLSCAGVCAGSCCAPTSSASHSHEHSSGGGDGRSRSGSRTHHGGWYCHKPTCSFLAKSLAVAAVVLAGVLLSVFLYRYLRQGELDSFQGKLRLLCLERSNTIQSQLNFSTTVLKHYLALFALIKGGSATAYSRLGNYPSLQRYARTSSTNSSINFLLFVSTIRSREEALAWEGSHNGSSIIRLGANLTRLDYNFSAPEFDWDRTVSDRDLPVLLPTDTIIPAYPEADLAGWDVNSIPSRIGLTAQDAAALGTFICYNRSTLLQDRGSFGFVVLLPLYSESPLVPPTPSERVAAWIGTVIGIVPIKQVVQGALANLDNEPVQLALFDRSAPENTSFLYRHDFDADAVAVPLDPSHLDEEESVSIFFGYGQRDYEVQCIPSSSFVESGYSSTPLIVAVGCGILFGIVLIMLVLGCLYSSMRRAILRSSALIQANRHKNAALDLLHEAKRIAENSNRSKSDFLAFLCHELRNPLHAIVAMIEFLQAGEDAEPDPLTGIIPPPAVLSESQQESIDTIQNSVRMMSTIVNDALDMSKIEAGKITFEIMRFSLVDLVTSLSQCEKPRAQAKGIQLLLEINPNVPPFLYGDPTRVRQVVANLLSNSIKFTSKGYVIISLSKISVDSFALPMMSVEEAGESRFQSDMSRTQGAHTVLGGGGNGGGGSAGGGDSSVASGMGLGAAASAYRQAPGATPGIPQRRLGGGGAGGIDQIEEDDEDGALLASRQAQTHPAGPSSAAAAPGVLEMVSPAAPPPVLHASFNYSPNPNLHRTLSDGALPQQQQQSNANGSPLAPGETPLPFPSSGAGMAGSGAAGAAAGLASFPGAGSRANGGGGNGANRPFTHVPLRPSGVPSSSPTLPHDQGGERLLFGRDIARESLPASGSRLGREHSSRTPSGGGSGTGGGGAQAFQSEHAILEISVTDTGMGIDAQTIPLLFEPYSQAKLSVMRSFGGTGLGLAIVKQIVEMMSGSISVKSAVGEGGGTTMVVRLPLPTAPSADSSGEVSEASHTNSSKRSRSQQEVLMRRSGSAGGVASGGGGGTPFAGFVGAGGSAPLSSAGIGGDDSHPVSGLGGGGDSGLHSPPTSLGPLSALPGASPAAPLAPTGAGIVSGGWVPGPAQQQPQPQPQPNPHATPSSYYSHMDSRSGFHAMPSSSQQQQGGGGPSGSVPPSSSMFVRSLENTPRAPMGHLNAGDGANNGAGGLSRRTGSISQPSSSVSGNGDDESALRPVVFHDDDGDAAAAAAAAGGGGGGGEMLLDTDAVALALPPSSAASSAAATPTGNARPPVPDYASDVRNRLAALAFSSEVAPSSSTSSTPTMKSFSRPLKPPRSGSIGERGGSGSGGGAVGSSAAASAASSASKKNVAAALAGMSLHPADGSGASTTATASSAPGSSGSGSLAQLAATRTTLTPVYPKDLRILIADDSLTNLKILARMLQGYDVTQAINGAEAVERVRDLILAEPALRPFEGEGHGPASQTGAAPSLSGSGSTGGSSLSSVASAATATPSSSASASAAPGSSPFAAGFSPTPQAPFLKQKGRQFDVIFSDVLMPVMDGQQASREIRKLERMYHLPPVPIVALTANAFLEDRTKCAAAGMDLFIAKPFSKSHILSIVQHVCQQNGLTLMTAGGAAAAATGSKARRPGASSSAHSSPSLSSFMLTPPAPPFSTPTTPAQAHASLISRTAPAAAAFPSAAAHAAAKARAHTAGGSGSGAPQHPPHHHSSMSAAAMHMGGGATAHAPDSAAGSGSAFVSPHNGHANGHDHDHGSNGADSNGHSSEHARGSQPDGTLLGSDTLV